MPASLDKLPDELLKLIIDHVDAADKSWRALGLDQGDKYDIMGDIGTDVVQGRWSRWHGRGVLALAYVDKRWNALARPILFKRVHWSDFSTTFFQLFILGEPLGRHVKELDLRVVDGDSRPLAGPWACALHKLPEVDTVHADIPHEMIDFASSSAVDDDDKVLVASGAEKVMARISTLHLSPWSEDAVEDNLMFVDGNRLRTLTLDYKDDSESLFNIPDALQHLVGLRNLSLTGVLIVPGDEPTGASLPSLRALELRDVPLEDALRFAAGCTPGITSLVVVRGPSQELDSRVGPAFKCTSDTLPQLRRLSIVGRRNGAIGRLLTLIPPHVEHLCVELVPSSTSTSAYDLVEPSLVSPELPAGLRELVLDIPSSAHLFRGAVDELERLCAGRGVAFSLRRPYAEPDPSKRRRAPVLLLWPSRAEEVQQTLEWATARARWLVETGDAQGIEELSGTIERLRQRRAIERL